MQTRYPKKTILFHRYVHLLPALLLLALGVLPCSTQAQTTREYFSRPSLANGAIHFNFFGGFSNNSWRYAGDTILSCGDTLQVYEFLNNTLVTSLIAIEGGKVFQRFPPDPCEPGNLLYDFDLEEGDTFTGTLGHGQVLEKSWRTLANGEQRRYLRIGTPGSTNFSEWIEGIGEIQRGIFPRASDFEGGGFFVCARDSSGILWSNPTYASQCDSLLCAVPISRFEYTIDQETVAFQNTSLNSSSWLWEFGDGSTSALPNPVHTYTAPGCYEVALTTFTDCRQNGVRSTATVPVCIDPAWSMLPAPPPVAALTDHIRDIHFLTPELGWVISRTSIWKTADGGQTWEQQFYPPATPPTVRALNTIHMLDEQTGIIGCGHFGGNTLNLPGILLTRDGGQTWETRGAGLSFILGALLTPDGQAFARRQFTTIDYSPDGGETWIPRHTPGLTLQQFQYMGDNTLYAFGFTSLPPNHTFVFAKSFDAGLTWQTSPSEGRSGYFLNLNEGWSNGDPGELLHTTDGGQTWQTYHFGEAKVVNSIVFTDATNGWAVGNGGLVLHTSDGGANWHRENCSFQDDIHCLSVPTPTLAFASGLYHFMHYTPGMHPDCATVATEEQNASPPKLTLAPNPVSSRLNVQLLGENSLMPSDRLLVFNMLGQSILERDCSDSPNVQLDVSALPSGTYLLLVLRNNKVLDRGRFVVVR